MDEPNVPSERKPDHEPQPWNIKLFAWDLRGKYIGYEIYTTTCTLDQAVKIATKMFKKYYVGMRKCVHIYDPERTFHSAVKTAHNFNKIPVRK